MCYFCGAGKGEAVTRWQQAPCVPADPYVRITINPNHHKLKTMKRFLQSFAYLLAVHVTGLVLLTMFRVLFWIDVRP